ncbi:MAG: glycerophosphodiester phosphodiesterase [Spirochaetes bacterium]|nr:glycerophosphodiester phosphodiesterase [Spirochaetota bacterium]
MVFDILDRKKERDKPAATHVFAHRGASKEFPENTLPAFERAVELGVDYIELDVRFTRDKRFALIHDETIDRVTEGSGRVSDYSMDELKKFDAGYSFTSDRGTTYPFRGKGIMLMSLDELLEAFPEQKIDIDIKDKNPGQIKHLVEIIDKYNAYDRVVAASKHYVNLKALRKMCPQIPTGFSLFEMMWIFFLYKCGLLFLDMTFKGNMLQLPEYYAQFKLITGSFIKELHKKGIDLHVWTVNREQDMRRLIDIGVGGIMSDDPALLCKVLGR